MKSGKKKSIVKISPKIGRPSKYSDALADTICELIATTERGLHSICKELEISVVSVFKWIKENENFSNNYARAKESQAELSASKILEIADDASNDDLIDEEGRVRPNSEWINRSRLRVDARKWIASKLHPKKYGDKTDLTTNGENINPVVVNFIEAKRKEDA